MAELNENISRMLQDCGLPADYLEPVYRCALCRDTGYTGELIRDPCDCLKKAYQEKLREKIGLGKNAGETFETFNAEIIPETPVDDSGVTQRALTEFAKKRC